MLQIKEYQIPDYEKVIEAIDPDSGLHAFMNLQILASMKNPHSILNQSFKVQKNHLTCTIVQKPS